ncbi:MAG: CBS domain-containing protein [Candidatus Saccharibacteria bacterium]
MRRKKIADILSSISVSEAMTGRTMTLEGETPLAEAQEIMMQFGHAIFPVMEGQELVGAVTYESVIEGLREFDAETPVKKVAMVDFAAISMDKTLRDAARMMAHEEIGRLIVVDSEDARHLIGILSRSDVLLAYENAIKDD